MISVNTVNGTKGMIGSSYLSMTVKSFMEELYAEMGIAVTNLPTTEIPIIEMETRSRFNSGMAYKPFMIPALTVMLITLIAGFLPALNIVSEKEIGTIEQINVTPVRKLTFILSKLIPYWIIGFVVLSLCFSIAFLVYGLVPHGSLWTLYLSSLVYILAISGFGLVDGNATGNVCDVFLSDYLHVDERIVYTCTQYARLGTKNHNIQPVEIFYRNHEKRLSQRQQTFRTVDTNWSALRFCLDFKYMGNFEL